MSDIVLSAGVRSNLLQLQQTSDFMTRTQTRLATGKRVNSALDNAINFFTAQGLDNRANDLSALLELDVERHQYHSGGEQRHHGDHEARAVGSVAGQPGEADHRHQHAGHPVDAVRRPADPDRPARWRLRLQRRQPAGRRLVDGELQRRRHVEHDHHGRRLHQRQCQPAEHQLRPATGKPARPSTWRAPTSPRRLPRCVRNRRPSARTCRPCRSARTSRRRRSTRCRTVRQPLRWRTRTKKARTCSPCRHASSCRPQRCRSPRRPTRTCCACSNKSFLSTTKRRPPGRRFFSRNTIVVNRFLTRVLTGYQP